MNTNAKIGSTVESYVSPYISQKKVVLLHLQSGKPISTWYAIKRYKITRLARVIYELRNDGHIITKEMVKHGKKTFALYSLNS